MLKELYRTDIIRQEMPLVAQKNIETITHAYDKAEISNDGSVSKGGDASKLNTEKAVLRAVEKTGEN